MICKDKIVIDVRYSTGGAKQFQDLILTQQLGLDMQSIRKRDRNVQTKEDVQGDDKF